MKVSLLSYTPDALELLLFTKQTRLKMSPGGLDAIKAWPVAEKIKQLEYMRNTIQSSWEFVDYVFIVEDVTRAFTHQIVRHRHNSYAQQAQRAVDMSGFEFVTPQSVRDFDDKFGGSNAQIVWDDAMAAIDYAYTKLVDVGIPAQDARGVLPTNICTNIVIKANLRSMHDMALKRLCVKAQGEAQDVFRAMRDAVIEVHPWADPFIRVHCATYGTCMFPTYPVDKCPAKPHVYDPNTGNAYGGGRPASLAGIHKVWANNRAEAQPDLPLDLKVTHPGEVL
jgi:flavin-dependent thymidylate synthase